MSPGVAWSEEIPAKLGIFLFFCSREDTLTT